MPEISIVILTFNSIKYVKSCLDSVFSQDYNDFEVILVDNGSKDGTASFIKENYLQVILIENKENLGTCKARNQAIEISSGEWILTMDCDIILENDFLSTVVEEIRKFPAKVGIIQPKILNADKRTICSCGIYLSKLRRFYDIGKGKSDNGQFNAPGYIFGACSAAALYKKEMLEEIKEDAGYFDERFFFLVEDVDLAWRAQRRGWKTLFYPEAVCYHFGNSSGYDKKFGQYLCFRNRYFLMLKNDSIRNIFKNIFFILPYDILRFPYFLVTNKYASKALGELRVILPKMLKKRRLILLKKRNLEIVTK